MGWSETREPLNPMFDHHFPHEVAIFGGEMPDIQTHPTIISIYFAHCTPIFFPIVIGEHFKYGEIIGIQLTYDYPYDYPPVSYFQGSKNQKNITTGGAFSKLAATSGGWGRDAGDIQITEDVTK